MIKNYSLIAEKWREFFENPRNKDVFFKQASSSMQSLFDTFIGKLSKLPFSHFAEKDKDILQSLIFESFLAGLILGGLEQNKNVFALEKNFLQKQGKAFFEFLDHKESFEKEISTLPLVSEALISKAASQIMNRFVFLFPEHEEKTYKKTTEIQNHFYFSIIAGYFLSDFL